MKKIFWVKVEPFDKDLIKTALESGADAIQVPKGFTDQVHALGKIKTISEDGDLKLGQDVKIVKINQKEDEAKVIAEKGKIPVIVQNKANEDGKADWTIIPLENLISKTTNLIQTVRTAQQAKIALTTMEKGADGILLETNDFKEIQATAKIIQESNNEKLKLVEAEILSTEPVAISDRCCIDTGSILPPGKGILAGDTSSAMFLVYNENVISPYCDPRPFRVNAGAVHAYVRIPNNKTQYMMELKSGSEVLIVDKDGNTEVAVVGRNKIEKRPMMLVRAKTQTGKEVSLIMQNAETIRLTSPDGSPISITHLKKGDKVMAYTEEAGRHFGVQVKETICER